MALPTSRQIQREAGAGGQTLDAEAALALADTFLITKVGDLLGAEEPRLTPDGRWLMSVTLSNAIQGLLGEVGTIAVDAASGAILFSEEERARVKFRARELADAASA